MPTSTASSRARVAAIDILRGITVLWVAAMHFYIDTRGVPGPDATASAAWAAASAGRFADLAAIVARSMVGLPGFRLDILLFVTGLVLSMSRPSTARNFAWRRARSILPNYWLGSLLVAGWLLALAGLRAFLYDSPFDVERHHGTLLAHAPYVFEWGDLLRSLSVVGRFGDPRTMQVVAPSLWYLVLVAQVYVVFPAMRRLMVRLGAVRFLLAATAFTCVARALAFSVPLVPTFDPNATVICFLPFRLFSPALGMVAAGWMDRISWQPRSAIVAAAAVGGGGLLLAASWLGAQMNEPGTWLGVFGPILPLTASLPGLWAAVVLTLRWRPACVALAWTGHRSLSALVVQDVLRFATGTMLVLVGGPLVASTTWWALLFYLGAVMVLTALWDPIQRAATDRWWPQPAPVPVTKAAVA